MHRQRAHLSHHRHRVRAPAPAHAERRAGLDLRVAHPPAVERAGRGRRGPSAHLLSSSSCGTSSATTRPGRAESSTSAAWATACRDRRNSGGSAKPAPRPRGRGRTRRLVEVKRLRSQYSTACCRGWTASGGIRPPPISCSASAQSEHSECSSLVVVSLPPRGQRSIAPSGRSPCHL